MKKLFTLLVFFGIAAVTSAQDVTFTATSTNASSSSSYSKLMDGYPLQKWQGNAGGNLPLWVLFNASEPIYVNGATLYTAEDNASWTGRNPRRWALYGSTTDLAQDASDWKLIQEVYSTKMPDANAVPVEFRFNPSQTAYQYFKLVVKETEGAYYMQLGELVLDYSTTAKTSIEVIASGGNKDGYGETADKIFDGKSSSKWYKEANSNWVVFKTASPIVATSYTIQTANDAEGRDPKTFQLYGAASSAPTTDGTTTGWTLIDSEEDASSIIPTARYAMADFDVDFPGEYQYYMLKVDATRTNPGGIQLSELILNGCAASDIRIISSDEDMAAFANDVNNGATTLNAVLMADVNSSTRIGWRTYKYAGTFDGRGHTVTLNISVSGANNNTTKSQGFIGAANSGTVVKNVIVKGSVNCTGINCIAALIGDAYKANDLTRSIIISNVGCEATVKGADYVGAFIGNNSGSGVIPYISDSYNIGNITATGNNRRIIAGYNGNSNSTFTNLYNTGTVEKDDMKLVSGGTLTNCYSTQMGSSEPTSVKATTETQVTSGELCYKLGSAFTQDLSQEGHPTFGSKTVTADKWFNTADIDVYYNDEGGSYTVYLLNLDDTKLMYGVPAHVTAKNVKMTRTLKAGVWNTFCSPIALPKTDFSAVKKLTGATKNGDNYTMTFTEETADYLEAGKPYMVQVSEGKTELTATDVTVATEPSTSDIFSGLTFNGNFAKTNAPTGCFIISNNVFYEVNSEVNLNAFRGYITVASGTPVKAINFDFDDDDATTIEMVNGQYSMVNGSIYNLAGQRINKMQKGINIVNGKKMVIGK